MQRQRRMFGRLAGVFVGLLFCIWLVWHAPVRPLWVKGAILWIEVARTRSERQLGLMHRNVLAPDRGMLFVFEREDWRSFWMKDTFVPLSIAFLDKQKKIINILDMQPLQTIQTYQSTAPAQFAVEVNRGWFVRHKVTVGDRMWFW